MWGRLTDKTTVHGSAKSKGHEQRRLIYCYWGGRYLPHSAEVEVVLEYQCLKSVHIYPGLSRICQFHQFAPHHYSPPTSYLLLQIRSRDGIAAGRPKDNCYTPRHRTRNYRHSSSEIACLYSGATHGCIPCRGESIPAQRY